MSRKREPKALGRPREFDADEALETIRDVFWAKGFEGATMSDLVAATGLKKGSLYAAFGDKRAMYLAALALYERTAIEDSVRLLAGSGPPTQRIGGFLQSAIDAVVIGKDRRGCFLCNASVDQAMLDAETERAVRDGFRRLEDALYGALADFGDHLAGTRRRAMARHLLSVYFGLRVLAKGGHPVTALKQARQAALASIPREAPR